MASKMALLVMSSVLIQYASAKYAEIRLHCDNTGVGKLSRDGGNTFETISVEVPNWATAWQMNIENPDPNTIFQFACTDEGGIGGLIAEALYEGEAFVTTEQSNNVWKLVNASDGDIATLPIEYLGRDEGPWTAHVSDMNADAMWVWCGWGGGDYTYNTLTFQVDFSDILGSFSEPTTAEPTTAQPTTAQPTIAETTAEPNPALSWYDEINVEVIDGVSYEFGWSKVMECSEGLPSAYYWTNPSTATLIADADSVKIVPVDGVNNPRYSDFAVIAKPGSNVMEALRDGFELSYQYDPDSISTTLGWADIENWVGSYTAKERLRDSCGPESLRPFSSVIYAAHCNGGGLHMYGGSSCLWEWDNRETGEDMEVYVGFIIPNTTLTLHECEKGINYAFDGIPCSISGDPHYTTFGGARHDLQGAADGQFYYLSQCAGSSLMAMPYSFIGKHTPWVGLSVQGLDYFTIALYGETDYYIFISANLHSFVEVAHASSSSYDDNAANIHMNTINSGADTQIGDFTFRYSQTSDSTIDALLTTGDGCTVNFYMQGQIWGVQDRYMMHAVVIQPPSCHRCHTCGICGNFKHSGSVLETCYGSTIPFEAGWEATNAFAYDADGNTWEQEYRDTHCPVSDGIEVTEAPGGPPEVFVPAIPDDFEFVDPCDEAIVDEVATQCEEAMIAASECCDSIGGSLCHDLLEDCKFDACVAAEGDAASIAGAVTAIFSNAVEMVCDIPDIGEEFDVEHLVEATMPPTTDYPTQEPTTSEPTTAQPTTAQPTTLETTAEPNAEPTSEPTTSSPTTVSPTTSSPTTAEPTTDEPTSSPTRPVTICYSDVECHGRQICDVYFCVDPSPGCCYGESYKANAKCLRADDQEGCDRNGCLWMVTDDPEDCVMTTTEAPPTPQPTDEVGCCKGDSVKSNDKCNAKAMHGQCDRSSSCHWIVDGIVDKDCVVEQTTTEEPGCCYENPDTAYSQRWMDTCTGYYSERECLMPTDDDSAARCVWEDKSEEYDCSQLWPTTTKTPKTETGCCGSNIAKKFKMCDVKDSQDLCERASSCFWRSGHDAVCDAPEEVGCCYEDGYTANGKCHKATDQKKCEKDQDGCAWLMTEDPKDCELKTTQSVIETTESGCCAGTTSKNSDVCNNKKEGRESCERSGKCEFRAGEDDCAWPTTTSEPWLGEEDASNYDLPVSPYARRSKQRRAANHKQESVLFGGEGVISETMQSTVSLSTMMVFVIAAFAAFQLFKWWSARKAGGYTKLSDVAPTAAQNSFQSV